MTVNKEEIRQFLNSDKKQIPDDNSYLSEMASSILDEESKSRTLKDALSNDALGKADVNYYWDNKGFSSPYGVLHHISESHPIRKFADAKKLEYRKQGVKGDLRARIYSDMKSDPSISKYLDEPISSGNLSGRTFRDLVDGAGVKVSEAKNEYLSALRERDTRLKKALGDKAYTNQPTQVKSAIMNVFYNLESNILGDYIKPKLKQALEDSDYQSAANELRKIKNVRKKDGTMTNRNLNRIRRQADEIEKQSKAGKNG